MATIELIQKPQERNIDYETVTMEDGTTLDFTLRKNGQTTVVRCSAKRDGKEIGHGTWNTSLDFFSIHVERISKPAIDARGIARAIIDGIIQILENE
jgi:hypothetical protein